MPKVDPRTFGATYVSELKDILSAVPVADIAAFLDALVAAYAEDRQVLIAGNGGSAATASHMANDLIWGLEQVGIRPVRAIALTDNVALITAIANDTSYEEIFARQIEMLGRAGDLFVAITGSGNSPNIVKAVVLAKKMQMRTFGILGMDGGHVGRLVDGKVVVPSSHYGPIEDIHMVFDHLAMAYLRAALAP
jgi:D-sedoheptulose 7-phosphate isomerase